MNTNLNPEVTAFLDGQSHPLRENIEILRGIILESNPEIRENIKWNGPNYCFEDKDRITMRIHPPKQVQLILHRGAQKIAQPATRLIEDVSGLLDWKENDRAVATFKNIETINTEKENLQNIVNKWIEAAR
ncbi:MAG: DUF1801 domain-containing protein [Bacteroidetes bacterium]|nr:DUF1801 domain-containing protein [Bacteroidota bacterium]